VRAPAKPTAGEQAVPEYKFYLIDAKGSVQAEHDAQCLDDDFAIVKAQDMFRGNCFEVWRHKRKIHPPTAVAKAPSS
jgi:hypothetical protein